MAVYYIYSGAAGSNNGSSWANAFTTLTTAFVTEVAGDTLYVAHDHAESTAAAITLASSGVVANPTKVICANRAGSVPPVSSDRRATAQVATTGASNISFTGFTHYDGIVFLAGDATAVNANIIIPNAAGLWSRFDNCSLQLRTTSTLTRIFIASSNGGDYIEWNNTTASFANVSQAIDLSGTLKWRNTPSAVIGSAVPNNLFLFATAARGGSVECLGVDLSGLGSGKTIVGSNASVTAVALRFIDCKLDAAVTKSTVPASHGSTEIDFLRCGASGVNYAVFRHRISGTLDHETTIVRSGGASDGTTPISWKIVTTANCTYSAPFECPPIAIWNDVPGSSVTATIEGIWGGGAVPNDDDIWVDVEYLGSSGSPQGSFVNDGKADLLATAAGQTSSSATWGGSTTKFKLNISFTAQQKGWLYARVKCGKASSTFYIDPLVTLT